MSTTQPRLIVQVLGPDGTPIHDALVQLTTGTRTLQLQSTSPKGRYTTRDEIPRGRAVVTVERRPFGSETRRIAVREDGALEVVHLLREGQPFVYRGRDKVPFTPDENRLALVIRERPQGGTPTQANDAPQPLTGEQRAALAERLAEEHGLRMDEAGTAIREQGIYLCSFPPSTSAKRRREIREALARDEQSLALPIVRATETGVALLTNEIMVKFEDWVDPDEVRAITSAHGLRIKRRIGAVGNLYHLTTGEPATYGVLSTIKGLAERDDVEFAEPNLLSTVEEDAITPTDYLFPEQWDHQIINTPDAWQFLRNMDVNLTFGSPKVIIGVVDSGVDPNHPDLSGTVSDGSSKIYQAFDFANMVANNNSLASGHGTSCAGAAASRVNNASTVAGTNEGVAGVAGNCRVLAIRRSGTESDYADFYLWAGGFDPESDDDDFPDPITPGADIISSSIGLTSAVGSPTSGTMAAVFDKLTDDGRDGKGVLLFFSAANNNSDNDIVFDRPWGMYSRCFSVAASTLANDGVSEVRAAYSNFGSQTEFCAPSNDAAPPLHNPTANYGAFTVTPTADPEGDGTVGRPTVQTTLAAAVAAGANTVTVAATAGLATGQALMVGTPGVAGTEAHMVTNVNPATSQVTLDRNLFGAHASGDAVSASAPDYRSDFGGTSYATPVCAGTAALMLSANPQLTWAQVRDLLRATAVKINPGETDANGRWQDVNGNPSNSLAYDGTPVFSEYYGYGRINAAAAVREAGWDIDLITQTLDFNDVPEGHTVSRAIRFNVRGLWPTTFDLTPPGAPFIALSTTEPVGPSTDSVTPREVYFWVTYQGTTAGDQITLADGVTATVRNTDTEQEWDIPVTANVVEEQTAALMLCLDRSASMDFPSGIGTSKRIDVLRFSANIMIDVLHEDNGLGIVAFDHDPHDVFAFRGPVGPPPSPTNPFDQDRTDMKAAINGFAPNPSGNTAIGDGIERALLRLNAVTGYDSKSIIVFTDGKETASKRVSEVIDLIDDRVFAIGLGKAENVEPATLNEVTASNDGYMLLANDLGTDSVFKLAKYFLQIQAAVNNQEIVVDPDGTLQQGQAHEIPFDVNEGDRAIEAILMLPHPSSIEFTLRSPNGAQLSPSHDGAVPGVTFGVGANVVYYRIDLPVPIGPPEANGTWTAVLNGRPAKAHSGSLAAHHREDATATSASVPYSLLVHASSDLRMTTRIAQAHYEPGAEVTVAATLTQFGIPLEQCSVRATATTPSGQTPTVALAHYGNGVYQGLFAADQAGTYSVLVHADGYSLRGRPFTREQVRSAFVWRGGNQPDPGGGDGGDRDDLLCEIVACLLNEKVLSPKLRDRVRETGLDLNALADCVRRRCGRSGRGTATLNSLIDRPSVREALEALLTS